MAGNRLRHKEYKSDEDQHEHSTQNSTYKHGNQDGIELRSAVSQRCYTKFFVGNLPSKGLRTGLKNLRNIKYICQKVNQRTYYGTMFDEGRGIPVFSAYTLTHANVNFKPGRPQTSWKGTPGIVNQGNNAIYRKQPYDKGHLVPAQTYSSNPNRFRSTFFYTDAVPQRHTFNGGKWFQYEHRIRVYAQQCTEGPQSGTLYLITGTAFGHIQKNGRRMKKVTVHHLSRAGKNPRNIAIPNSMWTAGCCVRPNGIKSFAVIGNNVAIKNQILMQQISVARLQDILGGDVANLKIGTRKVDLFPGNRACSNTKNDLGNLPSG
ncbi:PREDICTED: uncharacterized protein LOC107353403 [Acropora digitifera]|uniref:uncharacterized protein LOC107353403 n=1 Tax=Acropora digitifera TaxID=70779 RepID=UPI00077AD0CE|nr:PREDICTED: uncharacterized protein LOC107353403 [Acropora digitifera]